MHKASEGRHGCAEILARQNKVLLDALSRIKEISTAEKAMDGRMTERLWHAGHRSILAIIENARNEAAGLEAIGNGTDDFNSSIDPEVSLCDHVRDSVLAWKPTSGQVPPLVADALPDIASLAAGALLERLHEKARADTGAEDMDHPFAGLIPELMTLPDEEYDLLAEKLANPPPPSERLRDLMGRRAAWEKAPDPGEVKGEDS